MKGEKIILHGYVDRETFTIYFTVKKQCRRHCHQGWIQLSLKLGEQETLHLEAEAWTENAEQVICHLHFNLLESQMSIQSSVMHKLASACIQFSDDHCF